MRPSRWLGVAGVAVVLCLALAACGSDSNDDAGSSSGGGGGGGSEQTLRVGTLGPLTHGYFPLIAAQELDFYGDENLNVELVELSDEVPPQAAIENGQVDVAIAGPSEILFGLAEGGEYDVVFDPWTKRAEGIVTVDPAVQSLANLKGERVGVGTDEDRTFLASTLAAEGMSIDDVDTAVIGENPQTVADSLTTGKVKAYSSTWNTFGVLRPRGLDLRDLVPEDIPVTPTVSWIASREVIDSKREALTRFLRALAKGVVAGESSPDAVEQMYEKAVPDDWRDRDIAKALYREALTLYEPENPDEIGEIFPERFVRAEERLLESGELEEPVDIKKYLNQEFIAPANDFDRAEVKAAADRWLKENG